MNPPTSNGAARTARPTPQDAFNALLSVVEPYLAVAGEDAATRRARGSAAIVYAARDLRYLVESSVSRSELVAVEVEIDGRAVASRLFRQLPSPLALLALCAQHADEGHEVVVLQRLAGGAQLRADARWPFGVDVAEQLTRPAS